MEWFLMIWPDDLGEIVILGANELVTPRQLIAQGRIAVRQVWLHPVGSYTSLLLKTHRVEVELHLTERGDTEGFEISERLYLAYQEMGVPETPSIRRDGEQPFPSRTPPSVPLG
jgi:hypothetical protein